MYILYAMQEVTGEYSEFSLIHHNLYQKICWINEFGRLTGYIHNCSYIILVLGNYDGLTDLASEVVAD